MEHLDSILGPTRQGATFEIPYLSSDYDQDIFIGFGNRQGFNRVADLFQLHDEDLGSFVILLQRWLYFGLLWDVFDDRLNITDFVVSKGSRKLVSSTLLPRYSQEWLERSSTLSTKDLGRLWSNINFATTLSNRLDEHSKLRGSYEAQLIIFSIKLLIESLAITVEPILRSSGQPFALLEKPETSAFLLAYLRTQGWCPSRLATTSHGLQNQALYLLTAFETSGLIGTNHQNCTEQACYVDNLQDYPAQHFQTCSCHDCYLVHAPVEKVAAIYRAGHVPVLSCTLDPTTGDLSIDVLASQDCESFIAISHIWSDGLGNDTANALYQCQLVDVVQQARRLQSLLRENADHSQTTPVAQSLYTDFPNSEPVLFWLDTLCIPLDRDVRKLAIGRIDWTFAAAKAVLVRDPSIRHLSPFEMPLLQLAVHMRCLKWLTRCWTLAEGITAWTLYLDFADRAYNLVELRGSLEEAQKPEVRMAAPESYDDYIEQSREGGVSSTSSHNIQYESHLEEYSEAMRLWASEYTIILSREIGRDLMSIFDVLYFAKQGKPSFATAWNSVLHRSTTKLQDVPGILAVANSLSVRDVLKLRDTQRLKAIMNTFSKLPVSLLFNDGSKCDDEPKNKWVPTQIHGGRPMAAGPLLKTYREGRMLGPLHTSQFRTLIFPGTALGEFDLLTHDTAVSIYSTSSSSTSSSANPNASIPLNVIPDQLRLRVELLHARQSLAGQRWCLVLPEDFQSGEFMATTTCLAFCATVQKEHGERVVTQDSEGAEMVHWEKNAVVTWEMIAKVTVAPKVSADITTIHATELKVQRLYVECDMQDWQFPEALASSLTRKQTVGLDNRKSLLKSAAYFVIFFGLIVGIALVNSLLETKASEGVRTGLSVLLTGFLLAFFFMVISTREDPIKFEANRRVHAEWTALFLDPEKRAAQSRRYRFQRWLRQKYTSRNNTKAAREEVEEPESQLPKRGTVALSSFRRFFVALSNLSLREKVSLVRLSLCFAQLGLLACLDQALAGYGLQSTAIALTFLPVILLLILIPVRWVYYNPSEGRSILNDLVGMAAWIIHMVVLTKVIRSPLLKRHYSVGVAAVVLAAVQLLVIICLIIERQLSWFAQQWEKSPVIYYDLFEDPHEQRDEVPHNACCDCFGEIIWNPFRSSWERTRARLRHS